jgi:hypothetical protein
MMVILLAIHHLTVMDHQAMRMMIVRKMMRSWTRTGGY